MENKITKIWENPYFEEFMKIFEHKQKEDQLYQDLIWAVNNFSFDDEIYKYAVFSPEYSK